MEQQLIQIDWDLLVGGQSDQAWRDYILRKFQKIKVKAIERLELGRELAKLDALGKCSAPVLRSHPQAAGWYIALAGYSQKSLRSVENPTIAPGVKVLSFLTKIAKSPESVTDAALDGFSNWINQELSTLPGLPASDPDLCALHVAMIDGGLVIGQAQNEIQLIPHAMLKQGLFDYFGPETEWEFRDTNKDKWLGASLDLNEASTANYLRHIKTNTVFDFRLGGDRADIVVERNGRILLVGEIKGRKDLSNQWESWLPQALSHMETWAVQYPDALRGVFMTIITKEAITGLNRRGLRQCYDEGALNYAINLTLLAKHEPSAVKQFTEIFSHLLA